MGSSTVEDDSSAQRERATTKTFEYYKNRTRSWMTSARIHCAFVFGSLCLFSLTKVAVCSDISKGPVNVYVYF